MGLLRSSFSQSAFSPSCLASWSARASLVQPGSVLGVAAMPGRTGSRLAYRHMFAGPASIPSLVTGGSW
jgi:hypothetical protein